jgi:hypothetical protein
MPPEIIGIAGDPRAIEAVSTFLAQGGCYVIQPDEDAWDAVLYEIADALGHLDCGLVVVLVATDAAALFVRDRGGLVLHLRCCQDDEQPYVDFIEGDYLLKGDPDALCLAVKDVLIEGKTLEVCDG